MSTPTLTREQVITLQFIHRSAPAPCLDLSWDFLEDLEDEDHPLYLLVGVDDNSARLTAAGREALAAYNAANVTIPSNVARLAVEALNYMADHRLVHEAFDASMQNELEAAWRAIEAALESK